MDTIGTRETVGGRERGFTLVEVIVSILILSVGVLALVQVYTAGMTMMSTSQWDVIAKEKAAEAVESVFTARDTRVLQWAQIHNVVGAAGDGGVFLDGPQPMYSVCTSAPANDGLMNTADDIRCPLEAIVTPGADGLLGTVDDITLPLNMFRREIRIRDVPGDVSLRQVDVILTYRVGRLQRTYQLTTYISSFA
ncbi:MAG: prepilin-type N-terminal cleavage/methylation domain-containing protein [Acidobacteria bacterium]|nr:prepilin-type N-terminal cleavage/methylation domain-containing protein [Acidobacteriota bacterium]